VQVSGYVLLDNIVNVNEIPLTSLRVIRGQSLLRLANDPINFGYSLYVSHTFRLRELQLTSLHGEILSRFLVY